MQAVDDGKHVMLYKNSVSAFKELSTEYNWSAEFEGGMSGVGWYLARSAVFQEPSFKVYGNQDEYIDNILKTFEKSDHSVGVILSGAKGTGKTVFSKILSNRARKLRLPTVLINNNTKGLPNFLDRIDEPSLILFDEFEKKFKDVPGDATETVQNDMLSLFDGVLGGKNLYIITVNDIIDLSPYLLNRPGRFMFSIRTGEPSPEDIQAYLHDKLNNDLDDLENQINDIVRFSFKFALSYDILDALVFQLNLGNKFKEILPVMNLINFKDQEYNVKIVFEGGYTYSTGSEAINLFEDTIKINTSEIVFDFESENLKVVDNKLYVDGDNLNRVQTEGHLADKVKDGMYTKSIDHIVIVPVREDDYGF